MLQIVHRIKSLNSLTMSMFVDQAQYVTFKGQAWNKWVSTKIFLNKKEMTCFQKFMNLEG